MFLGDCVLAFVSAFSNIETFINMSLFFLYGAKSDFFCFAMRSKGGFATMKKPPCLGG